METTIPSKKQRNPGIIALNDIFLRMQKDVAESHHLSDGYLPELEKALALASREAIQVAFDDEDPEHFITAEDTDYLVELMTGVRLPSEKEMHSDASAGDGSFEDF